jgi:hypothetical protein
VREGKLLCRAIEAKVTEGRAKRGVCPVEHVPGGGKGLYQVLAHAWLLRALARKQEYNVHSYRRTIIEPHVKPAPKATSSTVEPSPNLPRSIASSSAIGIDAADVLPKRSTFT